MAVSEIGKDKLLHMYRKMGEIRVFEETAADLFMKGRLPGFLHSSVGQEASSVGACAALRPEDYMTSTHRGHGDIIAKGATLDRMMAELFAKETGYCKGKGGSMHIADLDLGILGATGIVGAGLPYAVGAALGFKMKGTDQVVLSFFGDGGSNTGAFHEALNLAAVWDLPVIFLCHNNQYAETTPQRVHQKIKDVAVRAQAHGIPGVTVDGMDVLAVYETTKAAVERAKKGEGPTLIESKTYRFMGHFVGDPGVGIYRTREEVEEWRKRDPIPNFRKVLIEAGVATEAELNQIDQDVAKEMEEAIRFAEASPEPELEEALQDIFVES
ncbi:MAG: thiamine pyrophosphate-dependent dehydrogenase E1 component subunit alpha [candidate division NC10 bacterium]|nr:thiamine pyrophosphate-dependent dehydrogenase E1 component subunit alpha [candidate division NC10 bacterium]